MKLARFTRKSHQEYADDEDVVFAGSEDEQDDSSSSLSLMEQDEDNLEEDADAEEHFYTEVATEGDETYAMLSEDTYLPANDMTDFQDDSTRIKQHNGRSTPQDQPAQDEASSITSPVVLDCTAWAQGVLVECQAWMG